jgi:hypothetical protein
MTIRIKSATVSNLWSMSLNQPTNSFCNIKVALTSGCLLVGSIVV